MQKSKDSYLSLIWDEASVRQFEDRYPVGWFQVTGRKGGVEHEVFGKSGKLYKAKCDLTVKERVAELDYTQYEEFNSRNEMLSGVSRLHFVDKRRTVIESADWKGNDDTDFRPCRIITYSKLKIARIGFNSKGWQRPTGEAGKLESSGSYQKRFGFGHEDWLFRNEWQIDGWRYAFLEGIKMSRSNLLKEAQAFNVRLFTKEPGGARRLVADIYQVECLSDRQAEDAREVFQEMGWYTTMEAEIKAVGGDPRALSKQSKATHVLNIRFRTENIQRFSDNAYVTSDDPIMKLHRYNLYHLDRLKDAPPKATKIKSIRQGSTALPNAKTYTINSRARVMRVVTPEHSRMQELLMQELQAQYGTAAVVREADCIDVKVTTDKELILYEIKSDQDPRTVIRLALGQILEYAYHPQRSHPQLQLKLVIVGRSPLGTNEQKYLDHLKHGFNLPIEYQTIAIS